MEKEFSEIKKDLEDKLLDVSGVPIEVLDETKKCASAFASIAESARNFAIVLRRAGVTIKEVGRNFRACYLFVWAQEQEHKNRYLLRQEPL